VKNGQPEQIISAGDRLLALDPDDPEAALQALKAAEAKKDLALIQKFSNQTFANGNKMASAPQPKEADQVESWKQTVDYAKQVATYADYALFRAALESRDPKETIAIGENLLKRSAGSEYANKTRDPLFLAYRQTNANDKAFALAEKTLETEQANEDMLLVVASGYLEQKKNPDKVHAYSGKVVEVMNAKPKPEGTADADWANRKNLVIGVAHYISGKQYFNDKKYAPSDQELRLALPLVETNAALKPETLFLLGVSDFNLEKIQDAADYFRTCSNLKSPFQAEAAKNLARIKRDYQGIK